MTNNPVHSIKRTVSEACHVAASVRCLLLSTIVCLFFIPSSYAQKSKSIAPDSSLLLLLPQAVRQSAPSREIIDSLKALLPLAQDTARVRVLNRLAWLYRTVDSQQALGFGQQGLKLAQEIRFYDGVAQSANYLGIIYRNRGDFANAITILYEAKYTAEQYGLRQELGYAYNNIGEIHNLQENYPEALENMEKARTIFEQLGDKMGTAYNELRAGEVYRDQKNYTQALEHFNKSLDLRRQLRDTTQILAALLRIAQVYQIEGRYDGVLDLLHTIVDIGRHKKDGMLETHALTTIARIYLEQKQYAQAIEFAEQGLRPAQVLEAKQFIENAASVLYRASAALGNYEQAYKYQQVYIDMEVQLRNQEVQRTIANSRIKYEIDKQQLQLSQEQEQKRLIAYSAATVSALLLVIAVMAVRNARRQKSINALLQETNEELLRHEILLDEQAREVKLANSHLDATNEKLQASNAMLTELNKEKNELLGIVSHDLKNPLNNIMGLSAMMENGLLYEFSSEDYIQFAKQIYASADRMAVFIKKLLDINAIESGKITLNILALDIASITRMMMQEYQARAEAKTITLRYAGADTAIALADETMFRQVLDNLLSNAVKYSPHGRSVWVTVQPKNDHLVNLPMRTKKEVTGSGIQDEAADGDFVASSVVLEVRDEGQGLSQQDKRLLFGKFARLSARPTGGEGSTGLGLSIVKKLVEAMNGRVWCESELGKGATFIVELPRSES